MFIDVLRQKGAVCITMAFVFAASPSQAFTIGVVAPKGGTFAILGDEIRAGANAAADSLDMTVLPIDEPCTDGSADTIARKLLAAKVDAAIGFLCSESLEGSLAALAQADIPALTLSIRGQTIMDDAVKHGWPLFRMGPSGRDEQDKIVDAIVGNWASDAFAIIDDGTIGARSLVDVIRQPLEERGMKPVFTDTYRPGQDQQIALVRRLQRAGVSHAFISGDRNDIAMIARDAGLEKIPLTIMGSDALRAADGAVPLPDGVLAITLPDYADLPEAKDVVASLRRHSTEPDGYTLPAYAAIQFLAAADTVRHDQQIGWDAAINKTKTRTVIGPISFSSAHEMTHNPFQLLEWRDGRFYKPSRNAP
ncbi:ABC transporter substrate-binding protein [Allorhizobium sp. BGMRC 0089]|uniref:ABC transporter substrate-binding protein n=1 Tax=Allorhizobium sonneratiae TaxID=2934936 RepID=UPI0020340DCD|nr:ABC transporter substrate-binding protein [Allorhizobium sonneratiae]MCM2292836.1 ABC transporter substrate-binding protein [Allorhizobium sonneratiae]